VIVLNKIESFGSGCAMGCPTCGTPNDNITQALAELGLNVRVVASTDIGEAQERGVKRLPALVIDGEVMAEGRALTVEEIKSILRKTISTQELSTGGEK